MKKLILASSIAAMSLVSVTVNAEAGRVYLNPAVGYIDLDSDRSLDEDTVFALGMEYQIDDRWGVEVLGLKTSPEHDVLGEDIDIKAYRLDGLYYLNPMGNLKPYLGAGFGNADFDFYDYEEDQLNIGGGVRYLINEQFSARADIRAVHGLDNSTWDSLLTLGVSFAFGGSSKPQPAPAPAPEPKPVPEPKPEPVPAKPADTDGDGVFDPVDQCPGTPADVKVDLKGCPLDSDKDGVADYLDKCLNSAPGARVDSKGCKLKKVRVEEMKLNIKFPTNSSVIPATAMPEIENVANFMKKHTDLVVDIEGHTDSLGKASYNKYLSQRRADAVAKVLIESFGVEASRVNAVGYGEEKPVASNDTKEGRQANRRVVAVLQKEVEE